jgi:hypothetical protein
MPDKNIVDDYYSKIPSDKADSKKTAPKNTGKPKIVARKKVIAKKKEPVLAEKKSETPTNNGYKKPYKKTGVVQTMRVVKKTDQPQAKRYPSSNTSG